MLSVKLDQKKYAALENGPNLLLTNSSPRVVGPAKLENGK
jgi:hypothetical protein